VHMDIGRKGGKKARNHGEKTVRFWLTRSVEIGGRHGDARRGKRSQERGDGRIAGVVAEGGNTLSGARPIFRDFGGGGRP